MNGGGDDEDVVVAAASSGDASAPLQWRFSQVFGERSAGEEVQPGNKKVFSFDFGFPSGLFKLRSESVELGIRVFWVCLDLLKVLIFSTIR